MEESRQRGDGLSLTLKAHESVRVKISSVGTYVPPRLLTNADLEKMVATNDQWITERTGIRERHIAEKGVASSDLGAEAARRCLAARGIAASEVEAIVVATVTPDMLFPATACLVSIFWCRTRALLPSAKIVRPSHILPVPPCRKYLRLSYCRSWCCLCSAA